jgi:hypothetical protein
MVVIVVPFIVIDTSLTTVFAEPLLSLPPPLFAPLPAAGWALEPDWADALADWAEAFVD